MGLFSKVIGTHSEREVKRVIPIVDKIESLEPEMEKLSDEELRGKTAEFKKRLADKETLDDIYRKRMRLYVRLLREPSD